MLLLGTSEEVEARNQANKDRVKMWLNLQRQANRDGQAAFHDFNDEYYETCRQQITSPRTKYELDTKARKARLPRQSHMARLHGGQQENRTLKGVAKGGSDGLFLASDMHAFEALHPGGDRTALSTNVRCGTVYKCV